MTVFHEFRTVLSPVLLAMIQSNHGPIDASDLNAILVKDAIYNAVGLAAFDLYDDVCNISAQLKFKSSYCCLKLMHKFCFRLILMNGF